MAAMDPVNASTALETSEKIAVVTASDTASDHHDFVKSELHIDDEAGAIAAQALASGPADAEISKRVLKKIDMYILPFLCITYGTSFSAIF